MSLMKIIWTDKYSAKDVVKQEIDDERYGRKLKEKYEKYGVITTILGIFLILVGLTMLINGISSNSRIWLVGLVSVGIGVLFLYWAFIGKFPDWDK